MRRSKRPASRSCSRPTAASPSRSCSPSNVPNNGACTRSASLGHLLSRAHQGPGGRQHLLCGLARQLLHRAGGESDQLSAHPRAHRRPHHPCLLRAGRNQLGDGPGCAVAPAHVQFGSRRTARRYHPPDDRRALLGYDRSLRRNDEHNHCARDPGQFPEPERREDIQGNRRADAGAAAIAILERRGPARLGFDCRANLPHPIQVQPGCDQLDGPGAGHHRYRFHRLGDRHAGVRVAALLSDTLIAVARLAAKSAARQAGTKLRRKAGITHPGLSIWRLQLRLLGLDAIEFRRPARGVGEG